MKSLPKRNSLKPLHIKAYLSNLLLIFFFLSCSDNIETPNYNVEVLGKNIEKMEFQKWNSKMEFINLGKDIFINLPDESKSFYVQTEQVVNITDFVFEDGYILSSKDFILITDSKNYTKSLLIRIGNSHSNNGQQISISELSVDVKSKFDIPTIQAYGIARIANSYSKDQLVANYESTNARVQTQCDVGGPGASSCSVDVSYVFMTDNCNVTCDPNYYACCQQDPISCSCVSYDSNDGPGTGGGSGSSSGGGSGTVTCTVADAYFLGGTLIIVVVCDEE